MVLVMILLAPMISMKAWNDSEAYWNIIIGNDKMILILIKQLVLIIDINDINQYY